MQWCGTDGEMHPVKGHRMRVSQWGRRGLLCSTKIDMGEKALVRAIVLRLQRATRVLSSLVMDSPRKRNVNLGRTQ